MTTVMELPTELECLNDPGDLWDCWAGFRAKPRVRHLEWCIEHVKNELGRPFDHFGFPHIGAPGGPSDMVDDPRVRTISEQFGAQVSKTFFGQSMLLYQVDTEPAPGMYAGPTEKIARDVVERCYSMAHQAPCLNDMLIRSEREQRQTLMDFRDCKVYSAWALSPSTLGDKPIRYGHAGEIDKWEHASTSKEAHPIKLFTDRFKQFQSVRKIVFESTPTIRGQSLIERFLLAGTNCRYWVPCPHCQRYQVLQFFDKGCEFGVKWEPGPGGRSDPSIAFATAHYVCKQCHERIDDHSRGWMMRRGVWCPEGCTVDDEGAAAAVDRYDAALQRNLEAGDGEREQVWSGWGNAEWIDGEPLRNGIDASYHLSSLYSLSLGWGDIAKEYVDCKGNHGLVRNFHNQWLANTWELVERKQTWQQLGERLISEVKRGIVPKGYGHVTIGVDKQEAFLPYVVKAWGPGLTNHTVAYGLCETLDELFELIATEWEITGGGKVRAKLTLMDSGYRPADIHIFSKRCLKAGYRLQACRGSSTPFDTVAMRRQNQERSANPGEWTTWVDTFTTQDWLDQRLHIVQPGDAGAMTIHAGSLHDHQDYLEQLLNDGLVSEVDKRHVVKERWQRLDPNMPNDFRDCERYAYAAVMIDTKGKAIPESPPAMDGPRKPTAEGSSRIRKLQIRKPRGGSFVRKRR